MWCGNILGVRPAIFLGLLIALYTAVHFVFPFVWGETVIFSWLISHGWVPHRDYWDQHTQGLPLLASLIANVTTNDSVLAFRVIWLATFAATLTLLFHLLKVHVSQIGASIAALIFTFWHIFWAKNTVWFHDPILFTNTLVTYFLLRTRGYVQYTDILNIAAAGVAAGVSILFKQTAVVFLPLYAGWLMFKTQSASWRIKVKAGVLFLAGAAIPLLLLSSYFIAKGAFPDFIRQVVFEASALQTYNQEYFGLFIAPPRISTLLQLSLFVIVLPFIVLLRYAPRARQFGMLLLLSLLGTVSFLYPQVTHTYAQLSVPPLAAMTAMVLVWTFRGRPLTFIRGLLIELVLLLFVLTLTPQVARLLSQLPRLHSQATINDAVTRWILQNTSQEEPLFICCGNPAFYLYANRIPASRFIHFSELYTRFNVDVQLTQELAQKSPRIIVYSPTYFDIALNDPIIYGEDYGVKKKTASFFLPQFEQFLFTNYRIVHSVSPTITIWESN